MDQLNWYKYIGKIGLRKLERYCLSGNGNLFQHCAVNLILVLKMTTGPRQLSTQGLPLLLLLLNQSCASKTGGIKGNLRSHKTEEDSLQFKSKKTLLPYYLNTPNLQVKYSPSTSDKFYKLYLSSMLFFNIIDPSFTVYIKGNCRHFSLHFSVCHPEKVEKLVWIKF